MSKKATPKARIQRRPSAKQSLAVPPLAAAIASLAHPMVDGVPVEFLNAYALMPALVAKLQAGDDDARWAVIHGLSGLEWAEREAAQPDATRPPDQMVVAVSVLNASHEDLVANLTTPIMDGAFFAGVAYACYMLTHGGK